jgi:hypothetical protein
MGSIQYYETQAKSVVERYYVAEIPAYRSQRDIDLFAIFDIR